MIWKTLIFRLCTYENVLEELKYRYEKEINLSQRSCLRKIYEKDSASGFYLVLCVADVRGESFQ